MSRRAAVGSLGKSNVRETTTRTDADARLLNVREIQERLGVSRTFVRSLQDSGEIPFSKLGKLRKSRTRDVDDYVARQRVVPPAPGP